MWDTPFDSARVVMMAIVLVAVFLWLVLGWPGALVNQTVAIKALETQGWTEVQIVNRHNHFPSWAGCDKNDDVAFDVIATNPAHKTVPVLVCAGWPWKGATIRVK